MNSKNVKSARDRLLDKHNLSMVHKSETDIKLLKCEARTLEVQPSDKCQNPFIKSQSLYGRNSAMCKTNEMLREKLHNQNVKSSSQYMNHYINHSKKTNEQSKKYCFLLKDCV